jgi:NitT/TauT family transport system substrate-binding protein
MKAVRSLVLTWLVSAGLSLLAAAAPAAAQSSSTETIRLVLTRGALNYLPLQVAIEKGFFEQEHIKIDLDQSNVPVGQRMPLIARGELHVLPTTPSAAIFIARNEGFNIKIISSLVETKAGWTPSGWVMVRKDLADQIKTIQDIRGRVVDASPAGSNTNFQMNMTLRKAGLTKSDVKYAERLNVFDLLAGFKNGAVEVAPSFEPIATRMVSEGLAVKLSPDTEVYPDTQYIYIVASEDFINSKRPAMVAFMRAVLRASKFIADAGPAWTPDILSIAAKTSAIPEDLLKQIKGPPYNGQLGQIDEKSLKLYADFWKSQGLLKTDPDLKALIDDSILKEARKDLKLD